MNDDLYNKEEQQFKDVIGVLKELPKIKSPDNFEYNLMTRIHNRKFDEKSLKENRYTVFGFLKPGIAVAVTAVILFFVIDYQQGEFDNPLISEPEKRAEIAKSDNPGKTSKEFIVSDNAVASISTDGQSGTVEENKSLRVVLHDNDVIAEENRSFPFPDRSVNLDNKLRDNNSPRSINDTRILAGTGTERVYFDGFYTGTAFSQRILDSLRNLDTLKRSK